MSVLILVAPKYEGDLTKELQCINQLCVGKQAVVLSEGSVEDAFLPDGYELHTVSDSFASSNIQALKYSEVVIVGLSREEIIPKNLLISLVSSEPASIRLCLDSKLVRYRPFFGKKSSSLLVFPGSVIPLSMGSHQRAFNLLAGLAYGGHMVDVLITGGKNLNQAGRLLESICPNVYTYKNNKRRLPKLLAFRRGVERRLRKWSGLSDKVPELFADRLSNKATYSLQKTLARLVKENEYKTVIVSYAWMAKCADLVPKAVKDKINWVCDTHDVQYIRNATANSSERRFFPLVSYDKSKEISVLGEFDSILAISESDKVELQQQFPGKVYHVGSSFEYSYKKIVKRSEKSPLNFGFIGGRMDANVKALLLILNEWWPAIVSFSPASKLYIAGSVGRDPSIADLVNFEGSVVNMGFVDNLNDFYSRMDVSLNPVVVQGGLNFKSVEAVASGKMLITNSLGIKCLGEADVAEVADSQSDIVEILTRYEVDRELYFDVLNRRQAIALDRFGDGRAYEELRGLLVNGS